MREQQQRAASDAEFRAALARSIERAVTLEGCVTLLLKNPDSIGPWPDTLVKSVLDTIEPFALREPRRFGANIKEVTDWLVRYIAHEGVVTPFDKRIGRLLSASAKANEVMRSTLVELQEHYESAERQRYNAQGAESREYDFYHQKQSEFERCVFQIRCILNS
jgi:hypothetical protein